MSFFIGGFMTLKDMVLRHLPEEDADRFALWAFGDEYLCLYGAESFLASWNILHCELMELNEYGKPDIDIPKMIGFWISEEEREKKEKSETWSKSQDRWNSNV